MDGIKEFCDSIMKGVIATGIVTDDNKKKAIEIMREEVKAFFTFTDDRYADQRGSVMDGTIHQNYVIADIVTECVQRLTTEIITHGKRKDP